MLQIHINIKKYKITVLLAPNAEICSKLKKQTQ